MAINLHQDFCSCDNKMGTCWADVEWKVENMMTKLARQKKVLDDCEKLFEFLIAIGKVDEGEGIWIGHSGQLRITDILKSIQELTEVK